MNARFPRRDRPGVTCKADEVREGGPLVRDYAHDFSLESACVQGSHMGQMWLHGLFVALP